MIFNVHSPALQGSHAFLSASKYHWIRYDLDKLRESFRKAEAARIGTQKHALAHMLITMGERMPDNSKTLNMYVNDAIRYRMASEQLLFVSMNCFGTPDAISFSEKTMTLRISDLKTGETSTSFDQLMVYAAMFCMEYGYEPYEMSKVELRIYQNDEIRMVEADLPDIKYIMEQIRLFDPIIDGWREEAL